MVYVGRHYERNATSGATKTYYHALGFPVAERTGAATTYLYQDRLGATVGASNGSSTTYWPYGGQRMASGALPTDRRFTDQRLEGAIGLYDFGARFYDPLVGRFVQPDPLMPLGATPQDLNRYAYGRNNPLLYTDPSGRSVRGATDETPPYYPPVPAQAEALNPPDPGQLPCLDFNCTAVVNYDATVCISAVGCARGPLPGPLPAADESGDPRRNAEDALDGVSGASRVSTSDDTASDATRPVVQRHHIFPQKWRDLFAELGIDIDLYTVELETRTHLSGVHGRGGVPSPAGTNLPGRWNQRWEDFFEDNPNASRADVRRFADRLMEEFGLSELPLVPYRRRADTE